MCLPLMVTKFVAPIETPWAITIAAFNKTVECAAFRKMHPVVAPKIASTIEPTGAAITEMDLGPLM